MSHEEILQRMVFSKGLSWDAVVETGATFADLNEDLIHQFMEAIQKVGRRSIPQHTTSKEFMRKMDLIQDDIPARAALLLFGKNPKSFFSSAFLKMGRFRSLTHIVDDREAHGSLFLQLDDVMNWFRERLETRTCFRSLHFHFTSLRKMPCLHFQNPVLLTP
jgi:ATP-dependent DNA helicase RecG